MSTTVSLYDLHEKVNAFMEAYKMLLEAQELQGDDALTPDEWENINKEVGESIHAMYEFFEGHQDQIGVTNGGVPVLTLHRDDVINALHGQGLKDKQVVKMSARLTDEVMDDLAEALRSEPTLYEAFTERIDFHVGVWVEQERG